MVIHIGIDAVPFERKRKNKDNKEENFTSMIGCAVVTENLSELKTAYYTALEKGLERYGIMYSTELGIHFFLAAIK